jgi:hypothetical protein
MTPFNDPGTPMIHKATAVNPFRFLLFVVSLALGLLAIPPEACSQGCVASHYMSLSLGAQGAQYLSGGQWEADVAYRFLDSKHVFIGTEEQPQFYNVGGRNKINAVDLSVDYGLTSRFSLSLTLPFEHDSYSYIQDNGIRYPGSSGGIGDLRLVVNGWVFDPATHPNGNVVLGLGVKFPTGNDNVQTDWHGFDSDGNPIVVSRPVPLAAQLGDGGFGILLQLQAFQKLVGNLFGYAAGYYLINPRNENGVVVPFPISNTTVVNSVPDGYFGRAGLSYVIWPQIGLSLSCGARVDGVPKNDLVGGSDGYRFAGYSVYVDPGINWSYGKNSLSVNVPVAVARNIEQTTYTRRGSLADYLVVASYSRRF